MGARPMARLIQDTIRKALADELLFGRLVSGGKVTIDVATRTRSRSSSTNPKRRRRSPSWSVRGSSNGSPRAPVAFVGGHGV